MPRVPRRKYLNGDPVLFRGEKRFVFVDCGDGYVALKPKLEKPYQRKWTEVVNGCMLTPVKGE